MYCRNCGGELSEKAEFCMQCGARPMSATAFCPGCGASTSPMAEICVQCGARVGKPIGARTWKSVVAGILCIIGGVVGAVNGTYYVLLGLLGGAILGWLGGIGGALFDMPWLGAVGGAWAAIMGGVGAIILILGIVALVGGVGALRRKNWPRALAGSICCFFCAILLEEPGVMFLGIPAIVLTVLAKREFA